MHIYTCIKINKIKEGRKPFIILVCVLFGHTLTYKYKDPRIHTYTEEESYASAVAADCFDCFEDLSLRTKNPYYHTSDTHTQTHTTTRTVCLVSGDRYPMRFGHELCWCISPFSLHFSFFLSPLRLSPPKSALSSIYTWSFMYLSFIPISFDLVRSEKTVAKDARETNYSKDEKRAYKWLNDRFSKQSNLENKNLDIIK